MYASYWYNASASASDVLSDLVAILTGETTVANLSTSCNKTSTTITASATVAGWAVYDASAGTNAQCLRAPCNDSALYKYMVLSTNTSGYLMQNLYEAWDSTAHTGTNVAYYSNTTAQTQTLNLTTGGRIEIYANNRCCLFWAKPSQGIWGEPTSNGFTGILERTRVSFWDVDACGVAPAYYTGAIYNQYISECRYPRETGAYITGSTALMYFMSNMGGGSSIPVLSTTPLIDPNTMYPVYPMYPFGVFRSQYGHAGGFSSSLCDVWWLVTSTHGAFDKLTYNGGEYVVWLSNIWRFAVRKG